MANLEIRLKTRSGKVYTLPHPGFIASGPPGNNLLALKTARRPKGCKNGWNLETKTFCLDPERYRVFNTRERLGNLYYDPATGRTVTKKIPGVRLIVKQNTELISTEPASEWYDWIKRLKDFDPDAFLIANVLAGSSMDEWAELVGESFRHGADAVVDNTSCPHGLKDIGAGSSIGEDGPLLNLVSAATLSATPADKLCFVKATPNVRPDDITRLACSVFEGGVDGITATNTYAGLIIDPKTFLPLPHVGAKGNEVGTWGGQSGPAILSQSLGVTARIGILIHDRFLGKLLGGVGGAWTGNDAAMFLAAGADFFMMCTRIMEDGYECLDKILDELNVAMDSRGFTHIQPAEGVPIEKVLQGFTLRHITPTQFGMVEAERAALASQSKVAVGGPTQDGDWTDLVADSQRISS